MKTCLNICTGHNFYYKIPEKPVNLNVSVFFALIWAEDIVYMLKKIL